MELIQKTMGAEIDVSFDCAGFNKTMSTALGATSAGGKVCLVGMGHNEMTIPLTPAAARLFHSTAVFASPMFFFHFISSAVLSIHHY